MNLYNKKPVDNHVEKGVENKCVIHTLFVSTTAQVDIHSLINR